jgi:hypothetical protein
VPPASRIAARALALALSLALAAALPALGCRGAEPRASETEPVAPTAAAALTPAQSQPAAQAASPAPSTQPALGDAEQLDPHGEDAPDERGDEDETSGAPSASNPWSPPANWSVLEPYAFEQMLEREMPIGRETPIARAARNELSQALGRMDASSVRAAVMLGRSRHRASLELLLQRLEKRRQGPAIESDAGDVTAAAALALYKGPRKAGERLEALAVGRRAHPDLEVRVECARAALARGRTGSIPFLLQVLRIDTHAGLRDERDFETSPQTAWARSRAAEALSAFAGLPCTWRADASIAEREIGAARLAEAVAERLGR